MKKGTHTRRIVITINEDTNKVKVSFTPNLTKDNREIAVKHLNGIINGFSIGLGILLGNEPMLRPPLEEEVNAKVYVFKDLERDNALFNARKKLYHELADIIDGTLRHIFPDVKYIEESIEHQQGIVTEMTLEEAADHQKDIERVVDIVKNLKEGDNDGDGNSV